MENKDYVVPGSDGPLCDLLNRYRNVEVVHPLVSNFCEVPENKEEFQSCLTYDYYVLRDRSQDLANSEISIYQKAFVILMEEQEDRIGGIEIYVDELLGLRFNPKKAPQTLATAVKARSFIQKKTCGNGPSTPPVIRKGGLLLSDSGAQHRQQLDKSSVFTKPRPLKEESLFLSQASDVESLGFVKVADTTTPQDTDFFVIDISGDAAPQPKPTNPSYDSKLDRLWETYQAARKDFMKDRTDCYQRTTAAKFLRDTAENCINYIEANKSMTLPSDVHHLSSHPKHSPLDSEKLLELRVTLKKAIQVAEKGSGGKKRSFDHVGIEAPRNPNNMTFTPRINSSIISKDYNSKEKTQSFSSSKYASKNSYHAEEMFHMPLLNTTVKKNPYRPAPMTTHGSHIFRDYIPTARRASFQDSRRSLSPREPGPAYRNRDSFQEPYGTGWGSNVRKFKPRQSLRGKGDCYRPLY